MSGLPQRFKPIRKEDILNPKIIRLEKLVTMIDPKCLAYYLEQISIFLKNTKRDLWFPMISADLDALLVRMITDEQNLRSLLEVFDDTSKGFAKEILDTLGKNEDVFKLVHIYESSMSNKNTLVYRKVFTSNADSGISNQLQKMSSENQSDDTQKPHNVTHSTDPIPGFKRQYFQATLRFLSDNNMDHLEYPEMAIDEAERIVEVLNGPQTDMAAMKPLCDALKLFRQTYEFKFSYVYLPEEKVQLVVEKVPLNNNKRDTAPESQKGFIKKRQLVQNLEPVFTTTALQMILDFITNETEASIVFKNANEEQSSFLQSACSMSRSKKIYSAFGEEGKGLLRRIGKVLGDGQNYELKIDVGKLDRESKLRTVSIIKHPKEFSHNSKNSPSTSTKYPPNIQTIDKGTTNNSESDSGTQMQIPPTVESNGIDNITSKVKTIDNTKANPNATIDNSKHTDNAKVNLNVNFIKTIDNSKATVKENAKTIDNAKSPDKTEIVECTNCSKAILTSIDNFTNNSVSTQATIHTQTDGATIIENTRAIDNAKRLSNPTPIDYAKAIDQARTIGKTQGQTKGCQCHTDGKCQEKPQIKQYMKPPTIDKNKSDGKELGIDKKEESKVPKELSDGRPMPSMKARLLEAMSVPVESDIAMRMMKQMGWDGGPLGARGDGLAEPILPALHFASGAGLGHVKPKKDPPKGFRLDILNQIHQFIREEPLKKTVLYPYSITKKERGFLLNAVRTLGRRDRLKMDNAQLQAVAEMLREQLRQEPALQLAVALADDKRSITLTKNDVQTFPPAVPPPRPPQQPPSLSPQQPPPEAVVPALNKHAKSSHVTGDVAAAVGKDLTTFSAKSAKGLGYRLILLGKLLALLKGSDCEVALTFEYCLTLKQVHFIREVVAAINLRSRVSFGVFENYLLNHIFKMAPEFYVTLEFGNTHRVPESDGPFTSLLMKKRPHQKRAANAEELMEIAQGNNNNVEIADNNKIEAANNKGIGADNKDISADNKGISADNKGIGADNKGIDVHNKVDVAKNKVDAANNKVINVNNKGMDANNKVDVANNNVDVANNKVDVANNKVINVNNKGIDANYKINVANNKGVDANNKVDVGDNNKGIDANNKGIDANYKINVANNKGVDANNKVDVGNNKVIGANDKGSDKIEFVKDEDKIKCDSKANDSSEDDVIFIPAKKAEVIVISDDEDSKKQGDIEANKGVDANNKSINKGIGANNNKIDVANNKVIGADDKGSDKIEIVKDSDEGKIKCDSKGNDSSEDDVIFIPAKKAELIVVSDDEDSKKQGDIEAKDLVLSDTASSVDSIDREIGSQSPLEKDGTVIKMADEFNANKRFRSYSDESVTARKKTKPQIPKYLCIAPDSYPIEEVDFDLILAFQNKICDKIDNTTDKPLIECVGLKNGAIIYGCHNENGIELIESVASELLLKTTNITNLYKDRKRYKVEARVNSYLDINLKKLFERLEGYNEGLKTDFWSVTDVKKNQDNIEMVIDIDGNSFEYISRNGFGLFAGVDKIRFKIVWN